MNELYWYIFVVLTLMHPIADFGCKWRKWKGEFWLSLNPLHAIWDMSPLRRHHKYAESKPVPVYGTIEVPSGKHPGAVKHVTGAIVAWKNGQYITPRFWQWLAIDQFAHVLLNLVAAWFYLQAWHAYFL